MATPFSYESVIQVVFRLQGEKQRGEKITSSGSPRVLEAEPKEMWRSVGALSGLQLAPPAVMLAVRNSAFG
jgi:hypothetical protein